MKKTKLDYFIQLFIAYSKFTFIEHTIVSILLVIGFLLLWIGSSLSELVSLHRASSGSIDILNSTVTNQYVKLDQNIQRLYDLLKR